MPQGLRDLPLLVWLMALTALAMLLPAAHAFVTRAHTTGRPFLYAAVILAAVTLMIGLATQAGAARAPRHSHLRALIGAYLVLPPLMAWPFAEAVPGIGFADAWFEMVSSFTTTGATLYDQPGQLPASLHLWRGLVGWLGGFFILVMAVSVLMPMNLGGMEVLTGRSGTARARQIERIADPGQRLTRFAQQLALPYLSFTALLWLGLVLAGETGFAGLHLAMATVSTSGILPDGMQGTAASGLLGEAMVAVLLCLGLTRRAYPGALFDDNLPLWRDPEVRMGGAIILTVTALLFLRHWIGAIELADGGDLPSFLAALWGTAFTTLSFLTTTGFAAEHWGTARVWSGLEAHGLILLGLAMVGGGVATTAGGVKLLRVYALFQHGQREMERMIHPHAVAGGGALARQLRGDGAQMAWIFFMLFALSIGAVTAGLTLAGLDYDSALITGIAALSNTGPLVHQAGEVPVDLAGFGLAAKAIMGAAMVLGRVEALAVLVLLTDLLGRR